MSNNSNKMPTFDRLMNPLIKAIKELGGSGTVDEIYEKVIEIMGLPDDVIEVPHGTKGSQTEVAYRLAWARTYLKKYSILENSERRVWSISQTAKDIEKVNPKEVVKKVREMSKKDSVNCEATSDDANLDDDGIEKPDEIQVWRKNLHNTLISIDASAFERLVQRVLRESGFIQVEVTGRTGDGGIDGKGIARINGFLSFHVMFQCKKYQGTVSANNIRDFRGAMQGRADKGLFITTGSFTRDAIKEATRDGAPPIDLIDGEQLMDKLKELSLGVKTKMIEYIEVDYEWFQKI